MDVRRILAPALAACAALAAAAAMAQAAPARPATPTVSAQLAQSCRELPADAADARSLALRSQCIVVGALPSERRHAEARELARRSLAAGEPAGGYMLYVAYTTDPANGFLRDGQVDLEAYRRLAARPVGERAEQVEAIDALAFASMKGHLNAGLALATHLSETVAPRNIERVRGLATLYLRNGEKNPAFQRLHDHATQVLQAGPTKASLRAFADAYRGAGAAAAAGYVQRNAGQTCASFTPKVLESTEIQNAEYLPLANKSLADSYLVRGKWVEMWNLTGCGQDVLVKVEFEADGWGGARFHAAPLKAP